MCTGNRVKALLGWSVMGGQEPAFPKRHGNHGISSLAVAVWGLGGTSALSL